MDKNLLYYGDNLDILRDHVRSESVDLVYLDPPFNSNASYNVLFSSQDGTRAAAQIAAFEDTWQWDRAAAHDYQQTVEAGGPVSPVGLVSARATEQKKGADKGIDGRLYFHDEGPTGKTKQVILSVKAGKTGPDHLRDLRGVVDREGAQIGTLITMQEPTQPMRTEAASAGFYRSPWNGKDYPRLQIRTIAELLDGRGIDYPAITGGNVTFKQARRATEDQGEQLSM